MRHLFDPRVQGLRARHAVYDLVVLLSVLATLQRDHTSTHRLLAYLVFTLLGVAFAEVYAGVIAYAIAEQKMPTHADRSRIVRDISGGLVLAGVPLIWVALAVGGVLSVGTGLDAAMITGLALLGLYAVVGARAAHLPVGRSLLWGLSVWGVGIVVILLKASLH